MVELTFEWQDTEGTVAVDATVIFPHLGYRSMLGWVQLVRSTDNESGGREFENDPFALFGDAPSPYCWYGQNPRLFDGPSRSVRDDIDWTHTPQLRKQFPWWQFSDV